MSHDFINKVLGGIFVVMPSNGIRFDLRNSFSFLSNNSKQKMFIGKLNVIDGNSAIQLFGWT